MYTEAGGQASDTGIITVEGDVQLPVLHVNGFAGYVVHWVRSATPTKE